MTTNRNLVTESNSIVLALQRDGEAELSWKQGEGHKEDGKKSRKVQGNRAVQL